MTSQNCRLRLFFGVQNFEFQYFLGIQKTGFFFFGGGGGGGGGGDVKILWIFFFFFLGGGGGGHHKIGLYSEFISMHFRVFSEG